jgi:hypothetical protein
MPAFTPAPPAVTAVYSWVLQQSIVFARQNAKRLSAEEILDLMDAIHNVPEMIYRYGKWHVEANIDQDLKRYNDRWSSCTDGNWRLSLLDELQSARMTYLKDMAEKPK